MIVVKKADQPIPKLNQFASEDVNYVFDLREILEPMELAVKVNPLEYEGLTFNKSRSLGTSLEIRISSIPLDTSPYRDYNILVNYTTSMNNTRALNFTLRIYK